MGLTVEIIKAAFSNFSGVLWTGPKPGFCRYVDEKKAFLEKEVESDKTHRCLDPDDPKTESRYGYPYTDLHKNIQPIGGPPGFVIKNAFLCFFFLLLSGLKKI